MVCKRCSAVFSVGAPYCPQCTSTSCYREDEDVPKTTIAGASNKREDGWDGTSSSASSELTEQTKNDSGQSPQSPAPTTELPSNQGQEGNSAAPSTDGSGAGDPYDTWTKDDLQGELADRELPISGNKSELIARLREDDAKDE